MTLQEANLWTVYVSNRETLFGSLDAFGRLSRSCVFTAAGQRLNEGPAAFTVASIKPTAANDDSFSYRGLPGGELIATGVTLKLLIMEAYGVRAYQVSSDFSQTPLMDFR